MIQVKQKVSPAVVIIAIVVVLVIVGLIGWKATGGTGEERADEVAPSPEEMSEEMQSMPNSADGGGQAVWGEPNL